MKLLTKEGRVQLASGRVQITDDPGECSCCGGGTDYADYCCVESACGYKVTDPGTAAEHGTSWVSEVFDLAVDWDHHTGGGQSYAPVGSSGFPPVDQTDPSGCQAYGEDFGYEDDTGPDPEDFIQQFASVSAQIDLNRLGYGDDSWYINWICRWGVGLVGSTASRLFVRLTVQQNADGTNLIQPATRIGTSGTWLPASATGISITRVYSDSGCPVGITVSFDDWSAYSGPGYPSFVVNGSMTIKMEEIYECEPVSP